MTETTSAPLLVHKHPRWHTIVAAMGVVLLTLAVFLPTLRFDFVSFDDADNIYDNEYMNPVNSRTLPRFWSESYYELYTPITYTLWTAVAAIPEARRDKPVKVLGSVESSLNPGAFHAEGVLFHTLNSLLVFILLLRLPLLRGRSPIYAALGAALWAVHPMQAESVAWVTGNNNVFSGIFMLLALLAFLRRLEAKKDGEVLGWYLVASVAYSLALLAKPTAAALPLVTFALAVGVYRQPWRSLLLPLGAWLLFAGAFLFITRNTGSSISDISLPLWERPFVVGDALAFYTGKILVPVRLALDYGRQPEWLRTQPWFYAMWLVPVSIGATLLFWYRRATNKDTVRVVVSGFAWFVLGALPMLGLAPYYFHRYSTVADRYVYLALVGVALAGTVGLAALPKRYRVVGIGFAVLLLGLYSVQCATQTYAWRDSVALYSNIVRVNPDSMMGHNNLAAAYRDEFDLNSALEQLNLAAACRGGGRDMPAVVQKQRGDILYQQGETDKAIEAYKKGIQLNHNLGSIAGKLVLVYWENGRQDDAKALVENTLTHNADPVRAAYDMGSVLLPHGVTELGVPLLEKASQTNGDFSPDATYILAMWQNRRGDNIAALALMQKALEQRPHWRDAETVLKQLIPLADAQHKAIQQQKKPGT